MYLNLATRVRESFRLGPCDENKTPLSARLAGQGRPELLQATDALVEVWRPLTLPRGLVMDPVDASLQVSKSRRGLEAREARPFHPKAENGLLSPGFVFDGTTGQFGFPWSVSELGQQPPFLSAPAVKGFPIYKSKPCLDHSVLLGSYQVGCSLVMCRLDRPTRELALEERGPVGSMGREVRARNHAQVDPAQPS